MRKYELVVLTTVGDKLLVDKLKKNLKDWQAKIKKEDKIGTKVLAYPIKKQTKGNYYHFILEVLEGEDLARKLNRFFKINSKGYLRHLLVLSEE